MRAWRLARGLEQRDAAARLGVRPATYGRWERDQKRPAIKFMPGALMLLGPGSSATQKSLPERLLSARQLLGLSQAALAERLGVDRGTVGDWERGVRLPSEERLAAVEALLLPGGGKPVREDGNEQAEEEDVAQDRDHRGDGASREPLVIAQVARVREPQKRPPDPVSRFRESRVEKRDEDSCEQSDARDESG